MVCHCAGLEHWEVSLPSAVSYCCTETTYCLVDWLAGWLADLLTYLHVRAQPMHPTAKQLKGELSCAACREVSVVTLDAHRLNGTLFECHLMCGCGSGLGAMRITPREPLALSWLLCFARPIAVNVSATVAFLFFCLCRYGQIVL